ncbi:hypothetical protein M9458_029252, partial [Cirrhinus mrigala]
MLAHSWPRGLLRYSFPSVRLLAQTLCKIGRSAAFLPSGKVGAEAVPLHFKRLCGGHHCLRILHAFSVSETCLEFGSADSRVTLRPRPGYVPKVPTTPFRDQVVNLQALPSEKLRHSLWIRAPFSSCSL